MSIIHIRTRTEECWDKEKRNLKVIYYHIVKIMFKDVGAYQIILICTLLIKGVTKIIMKLSLRKLIIFIVLLSVGLTLASSIVSGYRVSQEALVANKLETHRVYAKKVADITDKLLQDILGTLAYSAKTIEEYIEDDDEVDVENKLVKETDRLLNQLDMFNSAVVVSNEGKIMAISPGTLIPKGSQVDSLGAEEALAEKRPVISKPYWSITDRLIISISHPIHDKWGNYLGYVAGTIYLLEDNILNELLGAHFYEDGSFVYVVDEEGNIIYHPDSNRINDNVADNLAVKETMLGMNGKMQIVNSQGLNMLAGYADIPATSWGTVSQIETEIALGPADAMRQEMIVTALPFLVISLTLIIFIANGIASPLQKLGSYAEMSMESGSYEKVKGVQAWYYEAIQLEKALIKSFTFWEDKVNYFIYQSMRDPLTGLTNRRFLKEETQKWEAADKPYSVLLLDIDKFKLVNDTYGHATGDEVLKYLADQMIKITREADICCRYGGEEFIILMPENNADEAYHLGERLRKKLESTVSPTGKPITISAGIAEYPVHSNEKTVIEIADERLYEAKETGRNKIVSKENKPMKM